MKKIKLIALAVVLLTTVLLLASCGYSSFGDVIDREYTPDDPYPTYNTVGAVGALTDMTYSYSSGSGDLRLFTKYDELTSLTKYVVYDIANDKVVWEKTSERNQTEASITSVEYTVTLFVRNEAAYFTVTTVTTVDTLESGISVKSDETVNVAIWAWNGTAYAELVNVTDPRGKIEVTQDLIYFEGKVYRADKDSKTIAYAFDYSALATFPELYFSTENYYIGATDSEKTLVIYDKQIKQLATYAVPSYAEFSAFVPLGDQVLVQYWVEEDPYTDLYTVLDEYGDKYTVYTVLVDLETGSATELDTEYVLEEDVITSDDDEWTEEYGFVAIEDEVVAITKAVKVENYRIDYSDVAYQWVVVTDDGAITALELPTTMAVKRFALIAKDTWMLMTVDGRYYTMNGDGEIYGEIDISKGTGDGTLTLIAANGKLYDYTLKEVFDYQAEKLEIKTSTIKALLFTNEDDELIVYANGQKTTLINKDAAKAGTREYSDYYSSLESGYFVIVDTTNVENTKYEIYNNEGKLVKTVENTTTFNISFVARANDNSAILVKIITKAAGAEKSVAEYYRFS